MHPASLWTALGQVVATLLSLSSLFALARSPPVFYFSFLGSFDPVFRCLQGVLVGPTLGPLLQPVALSAPTGVVSSSLGSLSSSGTVPSTAGVRRGRGGHGRAVVVPSAPRMEPTPPPVDDFVPSRDGVLPLIRDELQALWSQLIPESPPLPVPSVTGGPQSGELPF